MLKAGSPEILKAYRPAKVSKMIAQCIPMKPVHLSEAGKPPANSPAVRCHFGSSSTQTGTFQQKQKRQLLYLP